MIRALKYLRAFQVLKNAVENHHKQKKKTTTPTKKLFKMKPPNLR